MSKKQKNRRKRILLTGGHAATTAMATVEELIRESKEKSGWDIYWVGVKSAVEGKKVPTLESVTLPKMGVSSYSIVAGRIQKKFTLWTVPSMAKIPIGFFHAFVHLLKIRPDVILSFGGFAAFPVVVAGSIFRIPIVLHDQTAAAGQANIYSSFFATKIALARKTSKKHFPKEKSEVVGNPVLSQICEIKPKNKIGNPPVIYVTGGSRGSRPINEAIRKNLKKLLNDFVIVHQAGHIDYKEFIKIKKDLSKGKGDRYEVYSTIDPMQVDGVFKRADIVVARAGANTVSDIMAAKRPAILIPLPFSFLNEQEENAKLAYKFGIAEIILQKNLSSDILLGQIYKMRDEWEEIVKRVRHKKIADKDASYKLVKLVEEVVR